MPSQNNTGAQYDKQHGTTVVATAAIAARRFIAYDGGHATSAGGAKDCQTISEIGAAVGEAITGITSYSGVVEVLTGPIGIGDYLKPAADGSGKAIVGTATDHCARSLGVAASGGVVEAQIVPHRRT